MLNRRYAIIWTNADPIYWCIYAAQGGKWVNIEIAFGQLETKYFVAPNILLPLCNFLIAQNNWAQGVVRAWDHIIMELTVPGLVWKSDWIVRLSHIPQGVYTNSQFPFWYAISLAEYSQQTPHTLKIKEKHAVFIISLKFDLLTIFSSIFFMYNCLILDCSLTRVYIRLSLKHSYPTSFIMQVMIFFNFFSSNLRNRNKCGK